MVTYWRRFSLKCYLEIVPLGTGRKLNVMFVHFTSLAQGSELLPKIQTWYHNGNNCKRYRQELRGHVEALTKRILPSIPQKLHTYFILQNFWEYSIVNESYLNILKTFKKICSRSVKPKTACMVPKAVGQSCSVKKRLFKIPQNSQENTCASCGPEASNFIRKDTLAQVFSCEFCETFNNTFL